jgi:uncharacterized protein (TIGR00290 family)
VQAVADERRGWRSHVRTLLSWSGGKDSALALRALRAQGEAIAGLLTTVSEPDAVVSHHHVPHRLIEAQAAAVGLPLFTVTLPEPCPNEVYEERMRTALDHPDLGDLEAVAFGDLFLEDVRAYREARLREAGLQARFPLWGADRVELADRFVADGFRAIVCVVDTEQLDEAFVGREFDAAFLHDLPVDVDPNGEHGEFHTFVTDGPELAYRIDVEVVGRSTDGRFARVALQPR